MSRKPAAAPAPAKAPRRTRGPSSGMDGAQIRILELLVKLLDAKFPVSLSEFDDESKWGNERTSRRMRQTLNATWERLRGRPLFDVVDSDGNPILKGAARYLKLADTTLIASRVERMSVLPAFLQLLSMVKGTILSETYALLYKQWRSNLDKREQELFDRTEKKFFYFGRGLKSYAKHQDVLDEIYDGLVRELWLEITFDRNGESRTTKVRPLTLVLFNSGLYLVCLFDNQKDGNAPYKFKVETIASARCLKSENFAYPKAYDPNRLFSGAFGFVQTANTTPAVVTVEFDAKGWVPGYLKERRWTASDAYRDAGNGRMQFTFDAGNLDEVLPWVLGFGPDLVVVAPEVLRRKAAEATRKMSKLYAD